MSETPQDPKSGSGEQYGSSGYPQYPAYGAGDQNTQQYSYVQPSAQPQYGQTASAGQDQTQAQQQEQAQPQAQPQYGQYAQSAQYGQSAPYGQQTPQYGYASTATASVPVSSTGVPLPPRNAGWAAAALIFFWPVAFAAFNHLHDIYPKWAMGDYQGAQYASDRVKTLGKIALWIFVIGMALFILLYVFVIIAMVASVGSSSNSW